MEITAKDSFPLRGREYDLHHSAHPHLVGVVAQQFADFQGEPLVDVGCGTGLETSLLAQCVGSDVLGVDPSLSMAHEGYKRTNGRVILGVAEELPFPTGAFKGVVSFFAMHHFRDWRRGLKEMRRILGASGKLILVSISHAQMAHCREYQFFPGLLELDRQRIPDIPEIVEELIRLGMEVEVCVEPYEERRVDQAYLRKARERYRSGLRALSDSVFRDGVARVERAVRQGAEIIELINCSVVAALPER